MKQIIKIKTAKGDFRIEELWSSYLFSYFFLFLIRNNLYNGQAHHIIVRKELVPELQDRLTAALSDLLKTSYVEPSVNELQKHPTRFEVLLLEGRKYKVNYRLSELGRMAYAIYQLINLINEVILEGSEVNIECN